VLAKVLIEASIAARLVTSTAVVTYEVAWAKDSYGALFYELVHKLPLSSTCGEGKLDARELLEIAAVLEAAKCGSLALVGPPATAVDGMVIMQVCLALVHHSQQLSAVMLLEYSCCKNSWVNFL